MSRQATIAKVEGIAERVGIAENIEVVEVELKGTGRNQLLRVFIDKPGGVTHGDCELMSQRLGDALDGENDLDHYTLEVSSPGVERKLKRPADFQKFQGQKVRMVIREKPPADRKNRMVEGTIAGAEESGVMLETASGERLHVPFESIDRANLKFEW